MDELPVAKNLGSEIVVDGVEKSFPVLAALVFSPSGPEVGLLGDGAALNGDVSGSGEIGRSDSNTSDSESHLLKFVSIGHAIYH